MHYFLVLSYVSREYSCTIVSSLLFLLVYVRSLEAIFPFWVEVYEMHKKLSSSLALILSVQIITSIIIW